MATNKTDLKKYFETGDKPTQIEYEELIEAFRHIDENLPIADIEGLQTSLDTKAAAESLLNHINDTSVHGGGNSAMSGADIKTVYEAEANTNAFTDSEKQQVADGVTHRIDTDSHVSSSDKTKWNNQLREYTVGEVLSAEMGDVYRISNGSLFKYTGDFPNANTFTTSDISLELTESPARWLNILSNYPPVEFIEITPKSMQPSSNKWIQIDAANIKMGTTVDFGTDISVLQYNYQSSNRMLVELQSTTNVGYSILPKINNGTQVEVPESFSISLGDLYVPDSLDSPWTSKDSNLIYTLGGVENTIDTMRLAGTFSDGIPIESDCSLTFSLIDMTGEQQIYFGFGNSTGSSHLDGAYFRSYTENAAYGLQNSASSHASTVPLAGSTIKLKRIKQTANTCNIEVYQNGVLQDTFSSISVTDTWYPYFRIQNVTKLENIELLIL